MPFVLALGAATVLTPLLRRLGLAAGIVARPGDPLRIHREEIPLLGGVGVVVATLGAVALVQRGISGGIMGATAVALASGLLDDVRTLPPWARVALLSVAGVGLAAGLPGIPVLAGVGVAVLAVACANAVNLIDGQDGLAGGLTILASLGLAAVAAGSGAAESVTLALALAGASLGFLAWNRPPARIFLGNGGAYSVGLLLGALAAAVTAADGWRGLLAAGACLGVFAFELVFTVARRLRRRVPMTVGDRLHSYDVVAETAGGRARSTALFWGLGLLAAGAGVLIGSVPPGAAIAVAGVGLAGSVALGVVLWSRIP